MFMLPAPVLYRNTEVKGHVINALTRLQSLAWNLKVTRCGLRIIGHGKGNKSDIGPLRGGPLEITGEGGGGGG